MADQQAMPDKRLLLKKLYVKDVSFESPGTPDVFVSNRDTEILLNLRTDNKEIDADRVEVALTVSVKSVIEEDTVFQIEVVQAGIFEMRGYSTEERLPLVGSTCPGTLYPFARETVTRIADMGGFQDLMLQPIDFVTLFEQNMQAIAAQRAQSPATS